MIHRYQYIGALLLALGLLSPAPAASQDATPTPEQLVVQRQQEMKKLGDAAMVGLVYTKGQIGTPADVARSAATLAQLAREMPHQFPRGTAIGVGTSRTKPELWAEWGHFEQLVGELVKASEALAARARSAGATDVSLKPAVRRVNEACGGCHEAYRGGAPLQE